MIVVILLVLALSMSAVDSCSAEEWRCNDGSCISSNLKCNGVVDCDDSSDEDHCRKTRSPKSCVYPNYPNDNTYFDTDVDNPKPGDKYPGIFINVTCEEGYGVNGSSEFVCIRGGRWVPSDQISECVRRCHLPPSPAVEYQCILTGQHFGLRPCNKYELEGTEVIPICRSPIYYAPINLRHMQCRNGRWLYEPLCVPDCGTVTPAGDQLIIDGKNAERGEMPWHAGIYEKSWTPYKQICGGSIISAQIVLSAAHCFWNEREGKQQLAGKYAVAVGKLYRPWDDSHDDAQKSDVKELHLSDHYKGSATNHQDDIAVVIVVTPFEYKLHIRPICIDFDVIFQTMQLKPGTKGKISGWGLTAADGNAAPILQVLDMPYVSIDTCYADSPYEFRPYLTSDKFCAGYKDGGKALCQGDSGGGLAFSGTHLRGTERYFLRGITSTASNNKNLNCNPDTYTAFTLVQKHEHFIKRYWVGEDDAWRSQSEDGGSEEQSSLANCIMPHSNNVTKYKAIGMPHAVAGRGYVSMQLEVTCAEGYSLDSYDALRNFNCFNGTWLPSQTLPECVALCRVPNSIGTRYNCQNPIKQKDRYIFFDCHADDYVPDDTIAHIQCDEFYRLRYIWRSDRMVCDNGKWNDHIICSGDCSPSIILRNEPWYVGIYSKTSKPYKYICAGTLIAESVVISAASCFWGKGKQLSPSSFAVHVGMVNQPWEIEDFFSKRSDVKAIYLPDDFREKANNCKDDIAVVILTTTLSYTYEIQNACIDGYGFVNPNSNTSISLYAPTWDKNKIQIYSEIPLDEVAGYNHAIKCTNTSKICPLVAGTGLMFPKPEKKSVTYLLRGIATNIHSCNSSYTDVTWLRIRERAFIRKVLEENSSLNISLATATTNHYLGYEDDPDKDTLDLFTAFH